MLTYTDPRLKKMSFYSQANMSGEIAVWRRARDIVKAPIVKMINYDRRKDNNELMNGALPKADATPPQPVKKVAKGSLASRIAAAAGAAATASPPVAAEPVGRISSELTAESIIEEWDRMPELEMLLLPCPETGRQPMNLVHWYYDKVLRRSKLGYLCLVALAFHGSPASAGSCERYFRGVGFVNDLKRCN